MIQTVDTTKLVQLSKYLSEHMGLNFPPQRWKELERGMALAAKDFGFAGADSAIVWLLSAAPTQERIEILASHLTVGETYFFREKHSLQALQKVYLEQIRSRNSADRSLRIWSAGCASGEEPYSIAMTFAEAMPDIAGWNISLLATDINPRALQKAVKGVYQKWSFRDCPEDLKQKYFKATTSQAFEIDTQIKKMVHFAYHNLVGDNFPSVINNTNAMDVIFCRNVLMYFTPEMLQKVAEKFHRSLVDEGVLFVSSIETSGVFRRYFSTADYPSYPIYKKSQRTEVKSTQEIRPPHLDFVPERRETFQVKPPRSVSPPQERERAEEKRSELPAEPDLYLRAENYLNQGSHPEAERDIAEYLGAHPEEARATALLARVQANKGKLAEALEWTQKSIAKDKLNPAYRYLLATILHEQGQMDEAARSLKRALYLNPNYVLAHFALGNLTLRTGKVKEAAKHFRNALVLVEKSPKGEILIDSEGMTAGRMREIIRSSIEELA